MPKVKMLKYFPDFLALRTGTALVIEEGLPHDSKVVNKGFDIETQMFYIIVESEEFEDIPEGIPIPQTTIVVKSLKKQEAYM